MITSERCMKNLFFSDEEIMQSNEHENNDTLFVQFSEFKSIVIFGLR